MRGYSAMDCETLHATVLPENPSRFSCAGQLLTTGSDQSLTKPLRHILVACFTACDIRDGVRNHHVVFNEQMADSLDQQFDQIECRSFVAIRKSVIGNDPVNQCGGLLMDESVVAMVRVAKSRLDRIFRHEPGGAPVPKRFLMAANGVGPGYAVRRGRTPPPRHRSRVNRLERFNFYRPPGTGRGGATRRGRRRTVAQWKAGPLPSALGTGRAVRNMSSQRTEAAECRRRTAVRFAYLHCACGRVHGGTGEHLLPNNQSVTPRRRSCRPGCTPGLTTAPTTMPHGVTCPGPSPNPSALVDRCPDSGPAAASRRQSRYDKSNNGRCVDNRK